MSNNLMSYNSPIFPNQPAENSPMTNLALNLGGTNIGLPARRKLALNNLDDSSDSSVGSPMIVSPLKPTSSDRLLKSSLRFGTPGSQQQRAPGAVTRRAVPRRLAVPGLLGDENYDPNASSDLMQTSHAKPALSPSKFQAVRQLSSSRSRQPLEDHDPNSQDSGYGLSEDSKSHSSDFCFAQPSGLAPRRSTVESPQRVLSNSTDSSDDGFSDFILPLEDEEAQLPSGLGDLIMRPIINPGITNDEDPPLALPPLTFMHCISENISPISLPMAKVDSSKKRQSSTPLEGTPVSKRLKPLQETTPQRAHQNTLFQYGFKRLSEPRPLFSHSLSLDEPPTQPPRPKFRHCLSESEAVIKRALHRSTEEELIGDFSQEFALPLVQGNHQDLKSISPNTLARLINGEFKDIIASFQIIDCRYPYEYDGGHIRNARNIYTRDQVMKEFLEGRTLISTTDVGKRNIIVFHCEFSSERGPGLSRFLRSKDRESNAYPALHHPELYLLEGGYKAFYIAHSELCEPRAYVKMVDADKDQLQHFRAKSKTWNGDKPSRTLKRSTSFKRLGL